jgi:hypothetical protein
LNQNKESIFLLINKKIILLTFSLKLSKIKFGQKHVFSTNSLSFSVDPKLSRTIRKNFSGLAIFAKKLPEDPELRLKKPKQK